MSLQLSSGELAMLNGELGPIRARALQHIVDVGKFFDAERLVRVSQAHIMADTEALGEVGVNYLEELAADDWENRRVLVPTITDPRGADFKSYSRIKQNPRIVSQEKRARDALMALGVLMTDTCINYQTIMPPVRGEHLAFGDTGVCIYSNSVLGARTNFEGGPSALASALTGYAPEYGFHLDRHRLATHKFLIEADLKDLFEWGALGALIGERMTSYFDVPYIEGILSPPSSDELKHFGAAMASYGSTALFHISNVTPEADESLQDDTLEIVTLNRSNIDEYTNRFKQRDNQLDVVVFSAPQLSLMELQQLGSLLQGEQISENVTLIAATSPELKLAADRMGISSQIENAGGILLEGVCFYQMHARSLAEANNWHRLMTNSAKLTNIIAGYGYAPVVASMEECVKSAIAGKVV